MAKHKITPGPWKLDHTEKGLIGKPSTRILSTVKTPVGVQTVAHLIEDVYLTGYGTAQGNAEFIVQACNAHDELVAVLRDLRDFNGDDEEAYNALLNRFTNAEPERFASPADIGVELAYRASAALRKARGEATHA